MKYGDNDVEVLQAFEVRNHPWLSRVNLVILAVGVSIHNAMIHSKLFVGLMAVLVGDSSREFQLL